jgi:hypothetical protein
MFKRRFHLPSPALVISMIALGLVLGGTSFAASKTVLAKHKDAKADTKLVKKLAPSLSVKHAKTANSAKSATNATNAVNATHATTATNATHATTADSATNATNATTAGNANNLGGQPPSFYVPNSAVQRGTFFLSAGTTGKVLFTDGPLSVTADCLQPGGPGTAITVNVNIVSTVDNWIWFGNTLEATAGTVNNDSRSDGGSGTFSGGIDRLEAMVPSGAAFHGQDAYGVNYPTAGQCYVSAWVNAL